MKKGVISRGILCPFIRKGDNIAEIVYESVIASVNDIQDNDIIGITESVIARSAGLYVTVDDIAADVRKKFGEDASILVDSPIYSRNRFSMILKGIARGAKKIFLYMPNFDEVGNPSGINPFTGVNIKEYYRQIIENEGCDCSFGVGDDIGGCIYCGLHDYTEKKKEYWLSFENVYTLADICSDKNPDFGVLGSNKATEESLKLFPTKELATSVCEDVKARIKNATGKNVLVCCYGDGCFHDPVGGIWEFADPVSMPGYTNPEFFESTPNEIKLKALIDETTSDEDVNARLAEKEGSLVGNMAAMGTTPRLYRDLVASLCDLTSGSGDRCTPVIHIQNYL